MRLANAWEEMKVFVKNLEGSIRQSVIIATLKFIVQFFILFGKFLNCCCSSTMLQIFVIQVSFFDTLMTKV